MQTRKKFVASGTVREHPGPKFCRVQKKAAVIAEKKVAELITSSARKQKPAGGFFKKTSDEETEMKLNTVCLIDSDKDQNVSNCNPQDHKLLDGTISQGVRDTLFSPAFHISNDGYCGDTDNDFMDAWVSEDTTGSGNGGIEDLKVCSFTSRIHHGSNGERREEVSTYVSDTNRPRNKSDAHNSYEPKPLINENVCSFSDEEYKRTLSSEVSAVYLSMQNSKFECVEPHESMSIECGVEEDESDDFDDFDPYLFIKYLPELSSIVPTFRPMLLPKQTRSCPSTTLVLDLDETLVHSTLEPCEDVDFTFPVTFNCKDHMVYVRCRPHLKDFLERVSRRFEIIIFTASQSIYAEQLLNVLDPKRRLFRHRVYRESCVFVDGNYLKDLSVLGRDLARVVMIDNSPQAFGFQVDNGIPIESWFDDRSDQELLSLLPFLESLIGVKDVRPLIAEKFNLRRRIEAAVPSLHFSK